MSFFNLRRGGQSSKSTASQSAPAESLEIVRKRAKHRLIGSAVLVLVGVIGFPLLFDTQPRPVSVGIPIEIPSKQGAKPLSVPPAGQAPAVADASAERAPVAASATSPSTTSASESTATSTLVAKDSAADSAAPALAAAASAAKVVEKSNEKSAEKTGDKANAQATKSAEEAARAKALLEGSGSGAAVAKVSATASSPATAAAGEARLVVQVGAFADVAKAREARLKLERAGLKTYTQVAETKDGKRIRVRVGPYATKAEADKAAKQIKALELPAAILTL